MTDDNRAVGPLATAKLVALIKAEMAKKYDKTGGKIDGSAEITGGLKVGMSSEFSSSIKAGSEISSDMLLMAPIVELRDPAKEESIYFGVSGENAAKVTSPVSGGGTQYARLAVGTPTGDNDAATKAYVDGKTHDYYDVTVISAADAAQTIDGGIISVRGSADKTVAEIADAYAAGAIVRCIYNGNIMQLMRATDGSYTFAGIGANYGVARSGNITITIMSTSNGDTTLITSAAGELPIPDSDGSQNGRALVVKNGQWAYSADKMIPATPTSNGLMSATDKAKLDGVEDGATKTIVDDAMSDTSTNPVQNKVVMKYIDSRGSLPPVSVKNDTMLIQVVDGAYALRTKESIFPVDDALDTESKNAVENGIIARRFEQLSGVTLPATSKRDGLMSAANYTKLSGIEAGATKTIVDEALDAASTNPVQNKAVKTALDGKAGTAEATTGAAGLMSAADKVKLDGVEDGATKTIVDDAMSDTSTNPVQNKAVKAALDSKLSTQGGEILGHLSVGLTVSAEGSVSTGRTSTDTGIHFEKAGSDVGRISHGSDPMTGVSPIARLKVASPTEDDDAATKKYVDDRAVRYDAAQTLDEAQQFQARKNIGAVGNDSPQFQGYVTLTPANGTLGHGVGLSPSGSGYDYTLDISEVDTGKPTKLTGVKTPTDADTNAAATVEYVKAKVASGGGVTVDDAMSDTSTNPVQNKVITSALAKKAGTAVATESANGLMSKADKAKLDGIAAGATKITIDSAMSGSSNNPVANHVVKQYVDDKVAAAGSNITVDSTLSSTSTNPVQNKAVKAAIDGKLSTSGGTLTGDLTGKYITGTWLRSTEASDLGRTPGKIAVLDDSGWVYYRTLVELFSDLGIADAIKSYVDSAIIAAINSAY